MRYDRGTEQAILMSQDQAAGQPAEEGSDGAVLVIATLVVLLALALFCRPTGRRTSPTYRPTGERSDQPPNN